MRKAYEAPKTWPEFLRLKVRMQRDILAKAARQGQSITESAMIADMERQHFSNTCSRLGIDPRTGEVKR